MVVLFFVPLQVQLASISSSPPGTPPQLKKLVRKPTTYDAFVNKFLSGDQKVTFVSKSSLFYLIRRLGFPVSITQCDCW